MLREALLDGDHDGTNPHLQSNWDDGEGYYKARIGELIGDRFQILGVVGKGVFSTVLKCADLRAARPVSGDGRPGGGSIVDQPVHVAVKLIRNNDTMRKAAEKEKSILLAIAEKDPENKRFCVRLITHLEYRNHVAMVFEYQSMNLRETLKKFGKDVGINIGAIRMYGRQLFVALKHLMDLRVVHADIKLDNILCSGDLKQVIAIVVDALTTFCCSITTLLLWYLGTDQAVRFRVCFSGDRHGHGPDALPGQQVLQSPRDHPGHAV